MKIFYWIVLSVIIGTVERIEASAQLQFWGLAPEYIQGEKEENVIYIMMSSGGLIHLPSHFNEAIQKYEIRGVGTFTVDYSNSFNPEITFENGSQQQQIKWTQQSINIDTVKQHYYHFSPENSIFQSINSHSYNAFLFLVYAFGKETLADGMAHFRFSIKPRTIGVLNL